MKIIISKGMANAIEIDLDFPNEIQTRDDIRKCIRAIQVGIIKCQKLHLDDLQQVVSTLNNFRQMFIDSIGYYD